MIDKVTKIEDAMAHVKSGQSVMVGGFTVSGAPLTLLHYLENTDVEGLTTISEDCGFAHQTFYENAANLLEKKKIKKICVSFVGGAKIVNDMIQAGELEYELIPQGTLAERIRAGGSGLGGILTPTGVGTVAAEGKQVIEVDGKEYLLEKPLHADVALIKAWKADHMGNAIFKYSAMNFNPLMAMAADVVILEVEELVETGEINPEHVQLPGVFVDYVVRPEEVIL